MTFADSLVYVIDDDTSMLKAIGRLLESEDYSVEMFTGAREFLARVPHTGPSCVILDLNLPGLNGLELQQALAERGVWVEGCAEGLGFASLQGLLAEPLLQLPPTDRWAVLTHAEAASGWSGTEVIATYRHRAQACEEQAGAAPCAHTTHLYWHSGAQFERWRGRVGALAHHACGPGKTFEHLDRAGVQNLRMFPNAAQWREWLGL